MVSGDPLVVGGAVDAVRFGVHDGGGESGDGVDEAVFGVVGDGVCLDDGGGVRHGDGAFGAELMADPAEPDIADTPHVGGVPQGGLDLVDEGRVDGVHEPAVDLARRVFQDEEDGGG